MWKRKEISLCPQGRFYRPQRSWAKVIFLQACVCPQGGRGVCLSACWDTSPREADPPESRHPPEQTTPQEADPPGSRPPGLGTPPQSRHPPEQTHPPLGRPPWEQTPPQTRHPPWEQTPPDQAPPQEQTPREQTHPLEQTPPGPGTHPPRSRLQHTVNERTVRVLLECILVIFCFRTCANCLAIITLILGQLARLLFSENRQYQFTWTTVHDIANKCLQYVVKNACI